MLNLSYHNISTLQPLTLLYDRLDFGRLNVLVFVTEWAYADLITAGVCGSLSYRYVARNSKKEK